ncbi:fungal-specific transcription factor domain-containing protein [Cadophora sp. MPI-SDFR-AT-0126]|nr:fungal-specific transcription factor domain-containing protein [Leotiomycetes sp. MPI-SDFR-AT-0126]
MDANRRQRKACDLCYTRKLKCDTEKPRCSNCVSYATDCTHLAQSRKLKTKGRHDGKKITDKKARPAGTIKIPQVETDRVQGPLELMSLRHDVAVLLRDRLSEDLANPTNSLELPPLQHTLGMLGIFLNSFNSILPLFHGDTLLSLVGECYALPSHQRDPVVWAAINVVLALATQLSPGNEKNDSEKTRTNHTTEYLNKAQSVISQVMLGETRLINVQVLVGMVMVLQTEHDLTAALVFISATMRLVHKMELHSRAASARLSVVERRQRGRVFWLAYILDKALSLRAKQPSVQLDDDIDLDLPTQVGIGSEDDDGRAGVVVTADGEAEMNFFLARIQLASIEGSVYDCLYSTRASKRKLEERAMARHNIVNALRDWQLSIPQEFGADVITSNTGDNTATNTFFCLLHSASLHCITLVNQAHAWDEKWVLNLRDQGRGVEPLQLPPGWEDLVRQARGFMVLFSQTWSNDVWFRWMASCSYLTAMVLLIANDLCHLDHSEMYKDSELVDAALLWLDVKAINDQREDLRALQDVCFNAVREVRRRRAQAIAMIQHNGLNSNFSAVPWSHQL